MQALSQDLVVARHQKLYCSWIYNFKLPTTISSMLPNIKVYKRKIMDKDVKGSTWYSKLKNNVDSLKIPWTSKWITHFSLVTKLRHSTRLLQQKCTYDVIVLILWATSGDGLQRRSWQQTQVAAYYEIVLHKMSTTSMGNFQSA